MRNLYLFSLLSMLFGLNCFGQNMQNSNWYFGGYFIQNNGSITAHHNYINFNPNPVFINSSPPVFDADGFVVPNEFTLSEGSATVSDCNGNLLMMTDGVRVYVNIGDGLIKITDSLKGHRSSTQNAVIVPRPNHPNRYYIFTNFGTEVEQDERGLYYSEFDLSDLENIGMVLNIPLRDSFNVPIDELYHNRSEAITTIMHSNNNDIWVLAHVSKNGTNQRIYSYLVTENGISNSDKPINQIEVNYNSVPNRLNWAALLKAHRTSNRFAISGCYGSELFTGNFDKTNGEFSNLESLNLDAEAVLGLDFSPSSNLLYVVAYQNDYLNSKIFRINLINDAVDSYSNNDMYRFEGCQLNIFNDLYIKRATNYPNVGTSAILKISNPNEELSDIAVDEFILPPQFSLSYFPQNVYGTSNCCLPDLTLTSALDNMNNNSPDNISHREREFWIRASNIISVGNYDFQDGVVYHAGDFVELNPGFEALVGSQFSAYIEGCSNDFLYKNSNSNSNDEVKSSTIDIVKNKVNIYPNPTSGLLNVSLLNNKIKKVTLSSIEGKVYVFEQFDNSENVVLDLSNYSSGIYLMNIETDQGEIINSKVIKN